MAIRYRCGVCHGTFETNRPDDAACSSCGERVRPKDVDYTDREGSFTIGGNVTRVDVSTTDSERSGHRLDGALPDEQPAPPPWEDDQGGGSER